jgi:hypothetical protein
VTAAFNAVDGRCGNCVDRCSEANRPKRELPSEDRISLVSVICSDKFVKSPSVSVS